MKKKKKTTNDKAEEKASLSNATLADDQQFKEHISSVHNSTINTSDMRHAERCITSKEKREQTT